MAYEKTRAPRKRQQYIYIFKNLKKIAGQNTQKKQETRLVLQSPLQVTLEPSTSNIRALYKYH